MIPLQKHIDFVWEAHTQYPRESAMSYRLWDQQSPYALHPVWCALTFLTETSLPEDLRERGALALLYHDVLEDTTCELPKDLDSAVTELVQHMTFFGGFSEEKERIWQKPAEVKLLKIYDKVSNLLDGTWMSPQKYIAYKDFTHQLYESVRLTWPGLNVYRFISQKNIKITSNERGHHAKTYGVGR